MAGGAASRCCRRRWWIPKVRGCSLAPICLPDEVNRLERDPRAGSRTVDLFAAGEARPKKPALAEVRRLITPRDELRPVYLNTPGLRVGKSGACCR